LQLRQVPQLIDSQQTPSVQWPLAHMASPLHMVPSGWGLGPPQTPAWQVFGGMQSASLPHPAKQVAPLQR